jgi:hypothetical protein
VIRRAIRPERVRRLRLLRFSYESAAPWRASWQHKEDAAPPRFRRLTLLRDLTGCIRRRRSARRLLRPNRVRNGLPAGGRGIRTIGPAREGQVFRGNFDLRPLLLRGNHLYSPKGPGVRIRLPPAERVCELLVPKRRSPICCFGSGSACPF